MQEFSLGGGLEECAPATHLYIAVLAYDGSTEVQTGNSILAGITAAQVDGIAITNSYITGCCYVDHARNLAVKNFLEKSDATDILFIDADVVFPPAYISQIAQLPVPVVGGVYPKKTADGSRQWPVDLQSQTIRIDHRGLMEVNGLPTGFLKINRKVFTLLRESGKCPLYDDAIEGEVTGYFQNVIENRIYWGEDYNFCRRWRSLGGKCYAHPNWSFGHVGKKTWKDNMLTWIQEKASSIKTIPDPGLEKKNGKNTSNRRVLPSTKPNRRRAEVREPVPGNQP